MSWQKPSSVTSVLVDLMRGYLLSCSDSVSLALSTSALFSRWIARFCIPEYITFDIDTTFTSQLWTSLVNLMGIILHQTTSYNPAANDMVQRFKSTLKVVFMSWYKEYNWFSQLPWILLGLRTTTKDALNCSSTKMVYGKLLVVLSNFFRLQPPPTISSA
ncbi:uncharacterized protein [Palaemon carinicauda]|uniref:uncharacterized protein n=1 Tax=Palaemon carinicauda TaxID=392227 RepID=UPI0035B67AFA